jgi:2-phosphosulfolactate phosphatase
MPEIARQEKSWFSQEPYRCRLDWGRRGAKAGAERGDLLVVVDTLTFSTAVATALHHGVLVYPCLPEDKERLAKEVGGTIAVKRIDVPQRGRFSLSPETYFNAGSGTKVVLDSPNGAPCCLLSPAAPCVVVGSLVNAIAVASFVGRYLSDTNLSVTVLSCGERWLTRSYGEELRFAIEDYLGAGAILSFLDFEKSPEAHVCEASFRSVRDRLPATLLQCGSGRELSVKGFEGDVLHASRLNLYDEVPVLELGRFINRQSPSSQPERALR